jgi:hypothetical protein
MKQFLYILIAVVLTLLVAIPVHFAMSKHIRVDREKAIRDRDAAYNELYELKKKFAEKNRVGKPPHK